MSRIYFHSPSETAEVLGRERAYMGLFCTDLATSMLGLRFSGMPDRLASLLPSDHYLRGMSREGFPGAMQWANSYCTAFGHGEIIEWAGRRIDGFDLALNTAVQIGNDSVRLLARLHAQCEIHAWVDGPDRAWLADVIDEARSLDLARPGMGWESVATFLRSRDDEPVVTSYSVTDSFPNAHTSDWMPPWPDGVPEKWDALTPEQQESRSAREESWYDLPDAEQWERGMAWLRSAGGGLQMTPANWSTMRFGQKLTVLDLTAEDYADRLDRAFGLVTA